MLSPGFLIGIFAIDLKGLLARTGAFCSIDGGRANYKV